MLMNKTAKKEVQHEGHVDRITSPGSTDRAEDRGFRMVNSQMATYEQQKLGLSTYYDKCWVLPDGIHTEPIKFHMT